MKTVTVLSQKGGSGKTTLVLHLAVAGVRRGLQVVVADLDPQASASVWSEVRKADVPLVVPTHPPALSKLKAEAEGQGADLLLIDTAPQSDAPAIAAAELADLAVITCRPSVMDLRAIQSTIRLTKLAGVKPHAVLTQVDPFGSLGDEARRTLVELGVSVLEAGMGRRVAYHHGLIDGQTALEFEPDGKAAEEARVLFEQISKLAGLPSSSRRKAS